MFAIVEGRWLEATLCEAALCQLDPLTMSIYMRIVTRPKEGNPRF